MQYRHVVTWGSSGSALQPCTPERARGLHGAVSAFATTHKKAPGTISLLGKSASSKPEKAVYLSSQGWVLYIHTGLTLTCGKLLTLSWPQDLSIMVTVRIEKF
jgi:hypothetical protein